jgi:hypothetical protein
MPSALGVKRRKKKETSKTSTMYGSYGNMMGRLLVFSINESINESKNLLKRLCNALTLAQAQASDRRIKHPTDSFSK